MFLILPLPTEDRVRLPTASILLTLLILAGFYLTWLSAGPAEQSFVEKRAALAEFLQTHPGASLGADDRALLSGQRFQRRPTAPAGAPAPAEELDADTQADLDKLVAEARAAKEAIPYLHYALVPARGFLQPGWVTSIFVHSGWLHLLGNLFFMYITAPFVEEALGSGLFFPFFLLGGIVANLAEFLFLGQSSTIAVMGASGAIAACLGAFGVRFATERRVKVFLWVFPPFGPREVRDVPAWIWVGYFGAYEAYAALVGSASGVAHLAHLGGLAFGAAAAFVWGKREPLEVFAEAQPEVRTHTTKALASIRAGDRQEARKHFANALQVEANHPDALLGLLRLELADGKSAQAAAILANLLRKHLAMRDPGNAVLLAREFAPLLDFERLGPQLAYALCLGMSDLDDDQLLIRGLEVAMSGAGLVRGKAMLRKARLCRLHGDTQGATALAVEVEAQFPDLTRDAQSLRAELEAAVRPAEALEI